MKATEIIKQVEKAECLSELSEVMNRVTAAVRASECDYDLMGWFEVLRVVKCRVFEIRQRVLH